MAKHFTEKLLAGLKKEPRKDNYKTTSFTLLKEDYTRFVEVCQALGYSPSAILRECVKQVITEHDTNKEEDKL